MSNHPSRSRSGPCRVPFPEEIERARLGVGLTIQQAAKLVCVSPRAWENWETSKNLPSHRPMPSGAWRLFLYEIGETPPPHNQTIDLTKISHRKQKPPASF